MKWRGRIGAVALLAVGAACNGLGGGGGTSASATVSGAAAGTAFDFTATQIGARFTSTQPGAGEASIHLCERGCPPLGSRFEAGTRAVSLTVQGSTADLRSGASFPIARGADAIAQLAEAGGVLTDEAIGGEVVIESADIRDGGQIIGTFQLQMSSGSSLSGFFEAPLVEVTGPVVVIGELHSREPAAEPSR